MQHPHSHKIRDLLRDSPDGMTAKQLNDAIPAITRTTTIMRNLHRMPDTYIDRWVRGPTTRGQYEAVWCAVVPPDNCPHPNNRFKPKTTWRTNDTHAQH